MIQESEDSILQRLTAKRRPKEHPHFPLVKQTETVPIILDGPELIHREVKSTNQVNTKRESIDFPLGSQDSNDDPVKRGTNWNFQPTKGITYEPKPVGKNQFVVNHRLYEKAATIRDNSVPSPVIVHPKRSVSRYIAVNNIDVIVMLRNLYLYCYLHFVYFSINGRVFFIASCYSYRYPSFSLRYLAELVCFPTNGNDRRQRNPPRLPRPTALSSPNSPFVVYTSLLLLILSLLI